jgi:cephalosporin hydroxylase
MLLIIDTVRRHLTVEGDGGGREIPLDSPEAFRAVGRLWLEIGWTQRYSYGFSWLGRPVIQLPEDLVRIQEVIYRVQPDVIVETGVAHGGSLIFYATLCKTMGRGRVIGVELTLRAANRAAIEAHTLAGYVTLVEGDSAAPETVDRVRAAIEPGARVLMVLDSSHARDHVSAEMEAYGPLVTPGSYIVVTDGIIADLAGVPGGRPDWTWNNPKAAALEFVARHPEFVIEEPAFPFNEGAISERLTYWPSGFVRRRGPEA